MCLNEEYNGQSQPVLPADILTFSSLEDSTRSSIKMIERFVARLMVNISLGMGEGNKVKTASLVNTERER
jgi:hypothetical protein